MKTIKNTLKPVKTLRCPPPPAASVRARPGRLRPPLSEPGAAVRGRPSPAAGGEPCSGRTKEELIGAKKEKSSLGFYWAFRMKNRRNGRIQVWIQVKVLFSISSTKYINIVPPGGTCWQDLVGYIWKVHLAVIHSHIPLHLPTVFGPVRKTSSYIFIPADPGPPRAPGQHHRLRKLRGAIGSLWQWTTHRRSSAARSGEAGSHWKVVAARSWGAGAGQRSDAYFGKSGLGGQKMTQKMFFLI